MKFVSSEQANISDSIEGKANEPFKNGKEIKLRSTHVMILTMMETLHLNSNSSVNEPCGRDKPRQICLPNRETIPSLRLPSRPNPSCVRVLVVSHLPPPPPLVLLFHILSLRARHTRNTLHLWTTTWWLSLPHSFLRLEESFLLETQIVRKRELNHQTVSIFLAQNWLLKVTRLFNFNKFAISLTSCRSCARVIMPVVWQIFCPIGFGDVKDWTGRVTGLEWAGAFSDRIWPDRGRSWVDPGASPLRVWTRTKRVLRIGKQLWFFRNDRQALCPLRCQTEWRV